MNHSSKATGTHPTPPESVMLDCDQILSHAGGDTQLLLQVCAVFLDEIPLRVASLNAALERDNGVERAVQQLRNCLLVFGSGQLTGTAASLELAVRQGRSRKVLSYWRQLHREIEMLIPQVQRLMLEISTPNSAVQ